MTRQDPRKISRSLACYSIWETRQSEKRAVLNCVKVLIGKTAADNDQLSLKYGKPDEALMDALVLSFLRKFDLSIEDVDFT